MLTSQRKKLILTRLARDGQIVAKALSEELGTSEDTIRRDLRELAAEGKLQRVHGGALPASAAIETLTVRRAVSSADKANLARAGAALIRSGQVVILDGGTTTTELAHCLPLDLHATVVTHSPGIAVELAEHPHVDVILLGGKLFKHSMVTVGTATVEAAGRLHADLYFMGVTGAHPKAGLTTGDYEEACVKRALHACAAETFVMASSEKLGAASPHVICGITEIAALLVPPDTPEEMLRGVTDLGVDVIRAA